MINDEAQRYLGLLRSSHWFIQVGKGLNNDVIQILSWKDAIETTKSQAQEDFALERANDIREKIQKTSQMQYKTWNSIVEALKSEIEPLIESQLNALSLNTRMAIKATIQWDILHILLSAHFNTHNELSYYRELVKWYIDGHFPCGWSGAYPDGQWIVY